MMNQGDAPGSLVNHDSVSSVHYRMDSGFLDFVYLHTGVNWDEDRVQERIRIKLPYGEPALSCKLLPKDDIGMDRLDPANHSGVFEILWHSLEQAQQMELWLGGPAGPSCPVEPNARQFLSANQCTNGWYTCHRPPLMSEEQPLLLLYRIPKTAQKEDLERQFPALLNITCLPYMKSYKNKTWSASADLPKDLPARDNTVLHGKEIHQALPAGKLII